MQSNFVLTDVMRTGPHQDFESFISMHTLEDQRFHYTGDYYTLHNYDLDSYDRKLAIIDVAVTKNDNIKENKEFNADLRKRCNLLHSQGFKFIKATPWESIDNLRKVDTHPGIDIPHLKWTGGVSWFWWYMYNKHLGNKFDFVHTNKKYDFLFLNKMPRRHRTNLYNALQDTTILDNSLVTYWPHNKKLSAEFELPWVDDYPNQGMDQDFFEKPYNETKYSLISESNDTDDEIFMTEKIWKPIIAQQPFVVHGNHLYLQKLREMGFKTFGAYFDESYDLQSDKDKKINEICKLCKDLLVKDWRDLYLHSKSLRQHNYDHFFDKKALGKEIDKTLVGFLEFFDSSQITS